MSGNDRHNTETLAWSVGGMDCASCAAKIEGALGRLPGVSDVAVSVMTERLTLRLAPGSTAPEAIERMVRGLGFTVAPGAAPASPRDPTPRMRPRRALPRRRIRRMSIPTSMGRRPARCGSSP